MTPQMANPGVEAWKTAVDGNTMDKSVPAVMSGDAISPPRLAKAPVSVNGRSRDPSEYLADSPLSKDDQHSINDLRPIDVAHKDEYLLEKAIKDAKHAAKESLAKEFAEPKKTDAMFDNTAGSSDFQIMRTAVADATKDKTQPVTVDVTNNIAGSSNQLAIIPSLASVSEHPFGVLQVLTNQQINNTKLIIKFNNSSHVRIVGLYRCQSGAALVDAVLRSCRVAPNDQELYEVVWVKDLTQSTNQHIVIDSDDALEYMLHWIKHNRIWSQKEDEAQLEVKIWVMGKE